MMGALPAAATVPAAASAREVLIVPAASPVRTPAALTGRLVCFIIGTPAEDALNRWASVNRVPIERLPFQEPDEMADALAVGKCAAAAVDEADRPEGARVLNTLAVTK